VSARDEWRSARTLEDLGELTARWLEGSLDSVPGHSGPPADETRCIAPTLAVLNRAGYVTTSSQPGLTSWEDGCQWRQRAFVTGLTGYRAAVAMSNAMLPLGYWVIVSHTPRRGRPGRDLPVTCQGDREVTGAGRARSLGDLRNWHTGFGRCHPDAVAAVAGALQVTVIDREWGSNLMWDRLTAVVA
jgi:hypothetical protein